MAIDDRFNLSIGDFGNGVSGNTWSQTQLTINYSSGNAGNVGIGISNQTRSLYETDKYLLPDFPITPEQVEIEIYKSKGLL